MFLRAVAEIEIVERCALSQKSVSLKSYVVTDFLKHSELEKGVGTAGFSIRMVKMVVLKMRACLNRKCFTVLSRIK